MQELGQLHVDIDMLRLLPAHSVVCDPTKFSRQEEVDNSKYIVDRALQQLGISPSERALLESLKAQLSDRQSVVAGEPSPNTPRT